MSIFQLYRDRVRFAPKASQGTVLQIGEQLLRKADIECRPIDGLLEAFHSRYLVDNASHRWSAFTFWTYYPEESCSKLTYASGIDLTIHTDYPRVLPNSCGVVGSLAERFVAHLSTEPYVSHDYSKDTRLAAKPTIDRLGFRSGIALPVAFSNQLACIFKLHFRYPLDEKVTRTSDLVQQLPHRLLLLLRLAEDHFIRLLARRATFSFQRHTLEPALAHIPSRRLQLNVACLRVLEDTCRLMGSPSGQIALNKDSASTSPLLSRWVEQSENSESTELSSACAMVVPLYEWNYEARPQVGDLLFQEKSTRLSFSIFERRFASEAASHLALHISAHLAIEDLQAQADRRFQLLQACSRLMQHLTESSTSEEVLIHLTDILPEAFSLTTATFQEAGEEESSPSIELLPSSFTRQVRVEGKDFGTLILTGREESDLSETDSFVLDLLVKMASQFLWSLHVMTIVETVSRDDARAELARDIVHALTADQTALINSLDSIAHQMDKLERELPKGTRSRIILALLADLHGRIAVFSDIARTQQNILQRYKWLSPDISRGPLEAIDFKVLQRNIKAAVANQAVQKSVSIEMRSPASLSRINWYATELYLIFWNLLNNAVKFSRKGGSVFFIVEENETGMEVKIRDFGVGIRDSDKPRIWEVGFSTIAPGAAAPTSGLGLPAVKNAVDRIPDARIALRTEANRFTEFTIFFPRTVLQRQEK